MEILFRERQRFLALSIFIFISTNSIFLYGIYIQLVKGEPFGTRPMSNTGLVLTELLAFLFSVFFFLIRLDTEIRTDGIYARFFPLHSKWRKYSWEQIAEIRVTEYRPIRDFGGWGLRYSLLKQKGRAMTISGKMGIQLVFTDGKKLLIGTQKPVEVKEALFKLGKATS